MVKIAHLLKVSLYFGLTCLAQPQFKLFFPLNDLRKWKRPADTVGYGTKCSYEVMVLFTGEQQTCPSEGVRMKQQISIPKSCYEILLLFTKEESESGENTPSFSNIKSQENLLLNRQPLTVEK